MENFMSGAFKAFENLLWKPTFSNFIRHVVRYKLQSLHMLRVQQRDREHMTSTSTVKVIFHLAWYRNQRNYFLQNALLPIL